MGLRLFPGGTVWDIVGDDPLGLYTALYRALAPVGLAYVHTLMNRDRGLFDVLRREWPATYIVNPSAGIAGRPADQAAGQAWLARGADLVSYGRAYLANPDLVERFRTGLPLREADPELFYAGGDNGYIDYSTHQYQPVPTRRTAQVAGQLGRLAFTAASRHRAVSPDGTDFSAYARGALAAAAGFTGR